MNFLQESALTFLSSTRKRVTYDTLRIYSFNMQYIIKPEEF